MKKKAIIFCLTISVISCQQAKKDATSNRFFSLKDFFVQEEVRLSKKLKNRPIDKSVNHNGIFQQKQITIEDWAAELSPFIQSDINKVAWKNLYRMQVSPQFIRYEAIDNKLRTRSILIKKNTKGQVERISIHNGTKNFFYQSEEQLNYIPDSIYSIHQKQHVIVIGQNKYLIIGKLK